MYSPISPKQALQYSCRDSFGYIYHHSWQAQRSWLNHRPPLTYHPNEFHLTCCSKEGEGADAQLLHVLGPVHQFGCRCIELD